MVATAVYEDDSTLIKQVAALVARAREATGQAPIFGLPRGKLGMEVCPLARGLNLHCRVASSRIVFKETEVARQVGEALGLAHYGQVLPIPHGHPFREFVNRFDREASAPLRALQEWSW